MELTGLYGITDSQLMPTDDQLLVSVEASLRGGTKIIQYRDKSNDADKRLRQACALVSLCDDFNVPCLINDDVTLAKQANATGVHLGRGDGNLSAAREFLGNKAIIGATCHG
ncbi:MAG: thiamine phosphate synthase, partial [Pontibacterium sp.]